MTIYTTLDSLVDTRLPLLIQLYGEMDFLKDKEYVSRTTDDFFGIPNRLFDVLYAQRDKKHCIESALPTLSIDFLNELCFTCRQEMANQSRSLDITLEVNLYPYVLTREVIETLAKSIKLQLLSDVNIKIISLETLTPDHIADKYTHIFMYDGLEWLINRLEDGTLDNTPLPEVVLLAPLLTRNDVEYNEAAMKQLMYGVGIYISLDLIAVGIMSAQL